MTLNALFKLDDIPCLISDRLAVTRYSRYITRKSSYVCPELVVAASGDEMSAELVLQRVFQRFSNAPVTRKGLLTDTLAEMRDIDEEHPCTLIGWFIEGRKRPVSFRWESTRPANPQVDRPEFVEGSGEALFRRVVPPFTECGWVNATERAIAFCVERAATLWINEVVIGALSRVHCGAGLDIYLYDARSKPFNFRFLDDIAYLYFRLEYQLSNGSLNIHRSNYPDYMKDTYGAVLTTNRFDNYKVSTFSVGSPQEGRESAGKTLGPTISPIAKMYACCFVIRDMKSKKECVEVLIAMGEDAEHFSVELLIDATGGNCLRIWPPDPIINAMAAVATDRALRRGMQLI